MPARVVVVGNEKGGAGKSTVAVHLATALLHEGARVCVVDLDLRQQSTAAFFGHRAAWLAAAGETLPAPTAVIAAAGEADLERALGAEADFVVVDTPGADTELSHAAHRRADLVVTPMNDSFVDFAMLGVIDPVSLEGFVRPSLYAEAVWNARKMRAAEGRGSIDWVVLRNRLSAFEPRNRRRVDERVALLARRVGFRPISGLRERVIYRELFPFGLTVADLSQRVRPVQVSLGHLTARQELRVLMAELRLVGAPAVVAAAE